MAVAVQSSCCAVLPGPVELLLILQDNILLVCKHLTAQLALQLISGCLVDVFTSLATPAQSVREQINAETVSTHKHPTRATETMEQHTDKLDNTLTQLLWRPVSGTIHRHNMAATVNGTIH